MLWALAREWDTGQRTWDTRFLKALSYNRRMNSVLREKSVINHWLKPEAWLVVDDAEHGIPCYGF